MGVSKIIAVVTATMAMATINTPMNLNQAQSFKKSNVSCNEFLSRDACQAFRRVNELSGEQNKGVWPHYNAAQLEELEC